MKTSSLRYTATYNVMSRSHSYLPTSTYLFPGLLLEFAKFSWTQIWCVPRWVSYVCSDHLENGISTVCGPTVMALQRKFTSVNSAPLFSLNTWSIEWASGKSPSEYILEFMRLAAMNIVSVLVWCSMQTVDILRQSLDRSGVEVIEKRFRSRDGIYSITQLFVSLQIVGNSYEGCGD